VEYLDKLENKIVNLIEAVKTLKTENSSLKAKINQVEEETLKSDKDKDAIQKKVLGMIEMIDEIKSSE
jgi:FtsZ-binding cell division protein ZapB